MKAGAHAAVHSSEDHNWRTPPAFVTYIRHTLGLNFDIDVAASAKDRVVPVYISAKENALETNWNAQGRRNTVAWCNPPYDKTLEFVSKAIWESAQRNVTTVMLLAVRTGSEWWSLVHAHAANIYFVRGRIKFISQNLNKKKRLRALRQSAGFDSVVVVIGRDRVGKQYQILYPNLQERGNVARKNTERAEGRSERADRKDQKKRGKHKARKPVTDAPRRRGVQARSRKKAGRDCGAGIDWKAVRCNYKRAQRAARSA